MSINESQSSINVILLDEDPIFSLGLKEICKDEIYQDINIIATGKLKDIFSLIKNYNCDLVAVALDWEKYPDRVKKFFQDLSLLVKEYPELNILLMVNPRGLIYDLTSLSIVKGYCYKNIEIDELIKIIRICAKGEQYLTQNQSLSSNQNNFNSWLALQCQGGIKEIERQIKEINNHTKTHQLSPADVIYWHGRKRELKLAKWLINRFLSESDRTLLNFQLNFNQISNSNGDDNTNRVEKQDKNKAKTEKSNAIILVNQPENVYDLTLLKIQKNLTNYTKKIQATDILINSKQKELLIIILQEWEELILETEKLQLNREELEKRVETFIKELWQNSTLKFLQRYLPSPTENESKQNLELVNLIINQGEKLATNELIKIPFIQDFLIYEIEKKEITIDNFTYSYGNENSLEIEEIILQNTILNIANFTVEFILNNFADSSILKHNIFQPELKSSRKVAMFRNNLVWKYRREKYWQNPKNIFEDQYEMLRLTYEGIVCCQITHPRYQELNTIKGIPWGVTILIELRDSLAKGVKSLGDSLGKLLVYLLTEVVGKGIGLIGKGILQGIGSRMKN
ncbi:DUF3685 domain-containing protein [Cyanobacterium aponinum AL20118]|uniref:DUF3685 domain-containing protein n=1 Tax=Cyanobacterium aponinum AL20115 TaxID=3090662 RepID=A0AAF1C625_9CHRO|nr:DUF3685 domain-containing protein [Cyanobacterium aponinum]WPF89440.1 DUF3685 domain-containing protein [Cyanobacterium aponinum AL20115]